MTLFLGEIVGWELFLVLGIVLLLFGGSRLPKLARSLGQVSKEFRRGLDDGDEPTDTGAES